MLLSPLPCLCNIKQTLTTMTPTIGFTNKYYTLWNVSNPYTVDNGYYTETKQDYQYIQNLSFDFDVAKQKMNEQYGEREWDINLEVRGKTQSFSKSLSIKYNEGVFLFGKYKGSSFEEINDFDYKQWYWESTKDTDKFSQELHDELQLIGGIVKWKDEWITLNGFEKMVDNLINAIDRDMYDSGHFHTEGEKVTLYLELSNSFSKYTHFGIMYTDVFIDKDTFRIYRYEGSKYHNLNQGDTVKITGTVKHVSYYNNYHDKVVEYTKLVRPQIKKV